MDIGGEVPVHTILESYNSLIRQRIISVIKQTRPCRHLYEPLAKYLTRGGKRIRPALCLATAQAMGGSVELALNSAVALELLHNAFLVHDDIEDGSEYRRGQPTLHAEYGLPMAINVSDAMSAIGARLLLDNRALLGSELSWRIAVEFEHLGRQSVEGQAMELGWIRDNVIELTEADYLRMVLKKTCWYSTIHPCRIGGLIASLECEADRFNRFGFFFGAAYQIQDDILNIVGEQEIYGKEICGDLLEGKRTLMLIHLLNACGSEERQRITRFLAIPRAQRELEEARWLRAQMLDRGSIKYAESCAVDLARAAMKESETAYARGYPGPRQFIRGLVQYAIERKF